MYNRYGREKPVLQFRDNTDARMVIGNEFKMPKIDWFSDGSTDFAEKLVEAMIRQRYSIYDQMEELEPQTSSKAFEVTMRQQSRQKQYSIYEQMEEVESNPEPVNSKVSFGFGPLNWLIRLMLNCLKCWISFGTTSFALMCVTVAFFSPRILTDMFIYPFCRLLFGTLYPAYASYKAVRTKNVKEYVKWMMYWIVFALFTCAETFTDVFFSWFPFYYEIKIILVFWLLSPATKGSSILYKKFVHPALCRREQEIDECITKAKEQGYHTVLNLGTRGVNYATNVIMQTAIKGGGGLVQQLRKSYSLSDLTTSDDRTDGRGQQQIDDINNAANESRVVRRTVSVRGKSPRNSGPPKVDMFFPEVDLDVGHNTRTVDSGSLGHIRSSEDISSTYIPENSSDSDSLTRTSSVGGTTRTRSKVARNTFTSIKRPGAAEEDEIIIEEIDDSVIPISLGILSNDQNVPEHMLELKNAILLDQYLKQFTDNSNLEDNYKKYLELKQMFDTFEQKAPVVSEVISTENSTKTKDKVDINIGSSTEAMSNNTECQDVKTSKQSLNSEVKDKVDINIKTSNEDVSNNKECNIKTSQLSLNPDTNKNSEIKDKVDINVETSTDECSNIKTSQLSLNSNTDKNIQIKDKVDINIETSAEDVSNNTQCLSVNTSQLSLNSDDSEFTTPNASPKLKNKKRKAPPPPSTSTISLNQETDVKNIPSTILTPEPLIPETVKELEVKHKEETKKSISKLLHLPTKFAFWNKESDSSDVKNETNDDESVNDVFEDANEAQSSESNVKNVSTLSDDDKDEKMISDPIEESQHVTYIPLKLETLVLHTESKSTDV